MLDGLEAAWVFFGGVVRRLVIDNLTPAVTRPDRYTPGLNRVFLEYAQYRGFIVDPRCPSIRPANPVELGIPYARQDFSRGERFLDVADMQARAVIWRRDLAGSAPARHHAPGAARHVRDDRAADAAAAPHRRPSDRPTWAWAAVLGDYHIQFRHALSTVAQAEPPRVAHREPVR